MYAMNAYARQIAHGNKHNDIGAQCTLSRWMLARKINVHYSSCRILNNNLVDYFLEVSIHLDIV